MHYAPPFTLNNQILSRVANISEQLGRLTATQNRAQSLLLRKVNRVRTIQGSLAIEGNQLTEDQITAILEGKRVIAPAREVQEASNALTVYEQLDSFAYQKESSLLQAHKTLMLGLIDSAGQYRNTGVGVIKNQQVIHMAPPADRVPKLMGELFTWLANSDDHPLIKSCVFHYEFEFIHPFADGNGRMGRLWQTLILKQYHEVFTYLPVESLIAAHQTEYYQAIADSTKAADSAPFIAFMLSMIEQALQQLHHTSESVETGVSPQVAPQVTPQVKTLIKVMKVAGETEQAQTSFNRTDLQRLLGLKDKKSFNQRYLQPALSNGLIEMTIPDKPTSRLQQYRLTALGKSIQVG
ncbi:Fic family protein [Vibrio rumoiensis]|uniref:Fic family protein n=1 Tax=Vibrio rumoiensis TaxID=76258 RepID=UPI000B5C90B9|nr:Fic family protein [Vibrio rumoiensis]